MNSPGHLPVMVAIETDATRYHGENASRPRVLAAADADQVLAHLLADLGREFPEIGQCAVAMPGALYDQTQLLRPAYPIYAALERTLEADAAGPRARLALGAVDGCLPDAELQPVEDIPLGLLQLLPLVVRTEQPLARELGERMEHVFLDSGQLSAHSSMGLEAQFGISVTHARFMTLTDLHAMLRLQLEHFGFLPLWDLLDAALDARPEPLEATGRGGQSFEWLDGAVHCRFETFDHWARAGAGRDCPDADQRLARSYAEWTREYRQYLTTLQAHGVAVAQYLPGQRDKPLRESYLVEEAGTVNRGEPAQVTEHSSGDLGTVAVTVVLEGLQFNYYPLSAAGLNDLHTHIRGLGLQGGVSFPGAIHHDTKTRRLAPDTLPP